MDVSVGGPEVADHARGMTTNIAMTYRSEYTTEGFGKTNQRDIGRNLARHDRKGVAEEAAPIQGMAGGNAT